MFKLIVVAIVATFIPQLVCAEPIKEIQFCTSFNGLICENDPSSSIRFPAIKVRKEYGGIDIVPSTFEVYIITQNNNSSLIQITSLLRNEINAGNSWVKFRSYSVLGFDLKILRDFSEITDVCFAFDDASDNHYFECSLVPE